jgi:hypothetical protein
METVQDITIRYYWQEANNMEFNSKKFELMRYGKNKIPSYFTPNWEHITEEKESLRDLGVTMSNDASFSSHVELVCGKVRQKTKNKKVAGSLEHSETDKPGSSNSCGKL